MPPQLLFDISRIDLDRVAYDQEAIRRCNPQRGDLEQLNAIIHVDSEAGHILGYKDIGLNEFWIPGHIPGRPLMPGVLMIEAGAQLASFYTSEIDKWKGFIGFSGVDDVRFRVQVPPGRRLYLLGKKEWVRHRRFRCQVQGVMDGQVVFEATILGAQL